MVIFLPGFVHFYESATQSYEGISKVYRTTQTTSFFPSA